MKPMKMCGRPAGICCPEVTVHDNGYVDVTDKEQTVEFTPEQWNTLKSKVKNGEL